MDFTNGLDANNGLGPDASAVTNKPWKTLAKLLGAAGMASGDTAYLAPGSFREVVTVAMTSAVAETMVLGDPGNAQGFKTSGGVLVPPGDVVWTAHLTDDLTAPSATANLTLAGRDFLTFQNIVFVGGSATTTIITATATSGANNNVYRDCAFLGIISATDLLRYDSAADVALNLTLDRCIFVTTGTAVNVRLTRPSAADFDYNVQVVNCIFYVSGTAVNVTSVGANAFNFGGVDVLNCDFLGCSSALVTPANTSTTIPCTIMNCLIYARGAALSANASGQITENYNLIAATTPRTNVSAGANSISGNPPATALLLEFGQDRFSGRRTRPFLTPMPGSGVLNFGSSGAPSVDCLNRPRPAGSGLAATPGILNAAGAYERPDTAAKETTTTDAGGVGLVIVGPGNHDIPIPVDATATTLTIRARYDTTHAATNKPQVTLLANAVIGVTTQTVTMTAAVDTFETLTIGPFTPTAKGIITIRLVSRSAAGGGKAFFDTLTGANVNPSDFAYFDAGEPLRAVNGTGASGSSGVRRLALTGGIVG